MTQCENTSPHSWHYVLEGRTRHICDGVTEPADEPDPLADEKELLARVTEGLAEARGRLYPTCSAWAFAKVAADANLSERGELSQAQRFLLFVLAADADRALNSPHGYSGTPLDRLLSLTRLGRILAFDAIEHLVTAGLIEEVATPRPTWKLPERFLAYMRD